MGKQKVIDNGDYEFWRLVIDSYGNSGLSVNKFCENEGISSSSFYQWRKKLEQKSDTAGTHVDETVDKSGSPAEPGFIPLGQIHSVSKDLCVAFPSGIEINASNACDVKLLCETVRVICEQRC
ncbi:MAG: IS66 family insertion sequence element accessory protein TnpA [Gammaproteobacteria bacterium]